MLPLNILDFKTHERSVSFLSLSLSLLLEIEREGERERERENEILVSTIFFQGIQKLDVKLLTAHQLQVDVLHMIDYLTKIKNAIRSICFQYHRHLSPYLNTDEKKVYCVSNNGNTFKENM